MKKFRYLLIIFFLSLLFSCGGTTSKVEERKVEISSSSWTNQGFFDGMLYYKIISNNPLEAMVSSCENSATTVLVPTWLIIDEKKYKVTSIGSLAFKDCGDLRLIEIPNSISSIGEEAFSMCTGLTSVTIPNSVTSIGRGAFYCCFELTSLVIPKSVKSIGNYAFQACVGLTSVTIPNSITSISDEAFSGCIGLTSVIIPNSVTSIGHEAFYSCRGLTSVTFGKRVKSIGKRAFSACIGLTSVHVKCNNPPMTYGNCFESRIRTLYIPRGTFSKYASTSPWSTFQNMVEE